MHEEEVQKLLYIIHDNCALSKCMALQVVWGTHQCPVT